MNAEVIFHRTIQEDQQINEQGVGHLRARLLANVRSPKPGEPGMFYEYIDVPLVINQPVGTGYDEWPIEVHPEGVFKTLNFERLCEAAEDWYRASYQGLLSSFGVGAVRNATFSGNQVSIPPRTYQIPLANADQSGAAW